MKILVPVTNQNLDEQFIQWVSDIALRFSGRLVLLNVQHSLETFTYSFPGFAGYPQINPPSTAEHDDAALKRAEQIATEAGAVFEAKGIPQENRGLIGEPAEAILHALEKGDFDLVVMKARDRTGAGRFLLGSITDKILHHSHVPLLILK